MLICCIQQHFKAANTPIKYNYLRADLVVNVMEVANNLVPLPT